MPTSTALHLVSSPEHRLVACEAIIKKHLRAFYEVSMALMEISEDKLYLHKNGGQYQTFAHYCKAVWGFSRANAYRQIEAAKVKDDLSPIGDISGLTEGVARSLTRVHDPDQRRELYQRGVAHAVPEHRAVTARDMDALVRETEGARTSDYSPIIKPTDNWRFDPIIYGKLPTEEVGEHGYLCGDFYANCLWYYSHPGDVVVDPMAGSGQLLRVYEDRQRWMIPHPWAVEVYLFDLTPRGPYQDRIQQHDLRASFPLPHADYIIVDPPYFGLVKGQYGTKADDLANMDLAAWVSAMDDIARSCSSAQTAGGRCTVVTTNYRNFSTKQIVLAPDLIREQFLRHGYRLCDKAYITTNQQQEEGFLAANTNNLAKKNRRLRNEIAEVLTFLKE